MNESEIAQAPVPGVAAPGIGLLMRETRVIAEIGRYYLRPIDVSECEQGCGQPIMVIPGFGASDRHTKPLRKSLNDLGFAAHGWDQGYNWGMRPQVRQALEKRLDELNQRHGSKVALAGWSLGGVFVREMARYTPDKVSMVFTMGSPINGHPNANNVARLFNLMNRNRKVDADMEGFQKRRVPPPVPCVAIHSKTDGIVAWQCAREVAAPNTENIEVKGTHFGMACNPQVIKAISSRLARVD